VVVVLVVLPTVAQLVANSNSKKKRVIFFIIFNCLIVFIFRSLFATHSKYSFNSSLIRFNSYLSLATIFYSLPIFADPTNSCCPAALSFNFYRDLPIILQKHQEQKWELYLL
jgi:predicted membrane channel-forming protein YqfA (hemolysin III family)